VKPEVYVKTVRRRRRSSLPEIETPPPPNVRNWVVYAALGVLVALLMFNGALTDRPGSVPLPELSQAADVRSTILTSADSLQIVVAWDLTLSPPEGLPDSVRVRVIPQGTDTLISTQSSRERADTAYIPAPKAGQTASGISCVTAVHTEEQPVEEACTPWQYVRPLAAAPPAAPATRAAAAGPRQIIVEPSGLQVDPDIGGKCAEWQRTHPQDSVWIEVNSRAVPDCTGPNRKPTVAQCCAFALLPDGRRLKTKNSSNNSYCDELFDEWIRERYS
jgi:hypothetical protein